MYLERATGVAQREQVVSGLTEKAVVLLGTSREEMQQRDVNCIKKAHGLG